MEDAIAVVIPCLNHARELRRTLECLRNQTLKPAEIVVVDNGSRDRPEKVAADFSDLGVRFVRYTQKLGAPAARNEGARLTTAPLMIFLDADVELMPQALEKFRSALIAHPDAAYAYSSFYWGSKKFCGRPYDADSLKKVNFIHTSSLLRRRVFRGFDEQLKKFQDWDMWLTLAKFGEHGIWIDEFLFKVHGRRGGISRWLPKFMHRINWPILGWMPDEIRKYRTAEAIIRRKHGI